jgi:O-acetyl-ADP-ribose deacetylase (regulator of RNase III)
MEGGWKMSEEVFRPLVCVIGNSTLRVEYSDLTTLKAEVLVSSDDIDLSMGGGVSDALLRVGGEEVWRETRQWAPLKLGDIAITTAGHLNAKHIFHAAVLDYSKPHLTTIDLIRKVTKKCLVVCNELGFQSIAFPALATGAARLSPERSAVAMLIEMAAHLNQPTSLNQITIALYARANLSRNVLPQFYAQVSDFLEMTQRLNSVTAALDNLEKLYRALNLDKAAESSAFYRDDLRRRRSAWEQEVLQQEPGNFREGMGRKYRKEIETDLQEISLLGKRREELEEIVAKRGSTQTWERLESEYKEYRSAALREMITIRKKT